MIEWKQKVNDLGILWLRVLMGLGMAYHGFGKVVDGNIQQLIMGVGEMGFPVPALFAWAAALSEFLGGMLVVVGLATRPASAFIAVTMAVAAFVAHAQDPFRIKELALAYFAVSSALVFLGPGRLSLDKLFSHSKVKGNQLKLGV